MDHLEIVTVLLKLLLILNGSLLSTADSHHPHNIWNTGHHSVAHRTNTTGVHLASNGIHTYTVPGSKHLNTQSVAVTDAKSHHISQTSSVGARSHTPSMSSSESTVTSESRMETSIQPSISQSSTNSCVLHFRSTPSDSHTHISYATTPTGSPAGGIPLKYQLILYIVPPLGLVVCCLISLALCLCCRRYRKIRRYRRQLIPLTDRDGSDDSDEEEMDDREPAFMVTPMTKPMLAFANT